MTQIRTDWTREETAGLFDLPFAELLLRAPTVHCDNYPTIELWLYNLYSIKTEGRLLARLGRRLGFDL